jgi:hypothetical protein
VYLRAAHLRFERASQGWKRPQPRLEPLLRIHMQKYLIAAVLVVSLVASVMAAEVFYIIFDNTLKGCTIATTEPSDKTKYWAKYDSKAEAEKAIGAMKEC